MNHYLKNHRKGLIAAAILLVLCLLFGVPTVYRIIREKQLLAEKYKQERVEYEQKVRAEKERERNDSFYEKLADGYKVDILVLGDSYGKSEGSSDEQHHWDQLLLDEIKENYDVQASLKNISQNYLDLYGIFCNLNTIDTNKEYDLAIICMDANGENEEDLLFYEATLRRLRVLYPRCSVITVLAQEEAVMNRDEVRRITEYYNGRLIDMNQSFYEEGVDAAQLISHENYPNDEGYALYKEEIAQSIQEAVSNRVGYMEKDPEPLNPKTEDYQYNVFVKANKFSRKEENRWALDLSGFDGTIGVVGEWKEGATAYDIYLDYNWFARNEIEREQDDWFQEFSYYENAKVEKEILIVFTGEKAKESFEGIWLNSRTPIQ